MRNFRSFLLTVVFALSLLGYIFSQAQAATTQLISTQVKVSICGNYVIEGGEDCEGLDLNGQNCYSLGFGGGQLSCDIACSFDTYECLAPIITPTPTSTPSPSLVTPTVSPAQDQNHQQNDPDESNVVENSLPVFIGNQVVANLISQAGSTTVLPPPLQKFDIRGDGRLRLEDLSSVVTLWVQDWKAYLVSELALAKESTIESSTSVSTTATPQGCDLNQDERCNLIDFSILLHYIEGEQ